VSDGRRLQATTDKKSRLGEAQSFCRSKSYQAQNGPLISSDLVILSQKKGIKDLICCATLVFVSAFLPVSCSLTHSSMSFFVSIRNRSRSSKPLAVSLLPSDEPKPLRLPLELFLEIFAFADDATPSALSRCSLGFLDLVTPFLYEHVNHWELPSTILTPASRRSPRIPDLFPFLAFESVRTLHLNDSFGSRPPAHSHFPHLPRLQHVHLHLSSNYTARAACRFSLSPFLSTLDPKTVTFHLYDRLAHLEWFLPYEGWREATKGWSRLESVFFLGGWISCVDDQGERQGRLLARAREGDPLTMVYDWRVRQEKMPRFEMEEMLPKWTMEGLGEVSILIRTSSFEFQQHLLEELSRLEEDGHQSYHHVVQVTVEGPGEESLWSWIDDQNWRDKVSRPVLTACHPSMHI
jgi:hypothetical protein